jgi:dipeptidyl-peptidase-3
MRQTPESRTLAAASEATGSQSRPCLLERVGEAAVVQLYADGFDALPLREKRLAWHLYRAAIAGRDIYYDQRYGPGLVMRDVLEAVIVHGRSSADQETYEAVLAYTKLFWINTGPHNNLTARKFTPRCDPERFAALVRFAAGRGAELPLEGNEDVELLLVRVLPLFFDKDTDAVVTCKSPGPGRDILQASANNLYENVSLADLEGFEERYALNSRLVKRDGRLVEEVYRIGGRHSPQIARIVEHLEAARDHATPAMSRALEALIRFYRTGENEDRRAYDVAWLEDRDSPLDTINGFVEVYMDARGRKGAWESLVYYVNQAKTEAIQRIAEHAQWFEDRMPWDPRYRKPQVTGVTARAIDVIVETGDSGPVTPVGINLPNDQEVRELHGSKSVSLSNVAEAYERSTPPAYRSEFAWDEAEVARATRWAAFASELTTNLHEVIGHGSGLVSDALNGMPEAALREHFSTIEEARADLVALYFVADRAMVDLGLIAADDHDDVVCAEYEAYARNALVQLRRIREGSQIEEDHMRNRQLIVHWLIAQTKAIDVVKRDGKTYYRLADVHAFRSGVAWLLAEVQRIKAEGDYAAACALIDGHGVHFDPALRDEIVARVDSLDLPSYTGFVMPRLAPVIDEHGEIADVSITYPCDLQTQMLEYAALTRETRSRK